MRKLKIYSGDAAGLICFTWELKVGYLTVHLLMRPTFWKNSTWIYKEDWYDGPIHTFGIGPLIQIYRDYEPHDNEED